MSCCGCFPSGPPQPEKGRKKSGAPGSAARRQRVELNVGGQKFCTSRATLLRYAGTPLAELVQGDPDEDGSYFLDRDGTHFGSILTFLRDGVDVFSPPVDDQACSSLKHEAQQLGIIDLVRLLDEVLASRKPPEAGPGSGGAGGGGSRGEVDYFGAPVPVNETQRLDLLKGLNVLYTKPEHQYDSINNVLAALLDIPIVLLSLVAEDEQWFKAKCGIGAESTPRNTSFCAFTFKPERPDAAGILIIEDAERDSRVSQNPLVLGEPFIRFYAGCPLVTSNGLRLGALCLIDRIPKSLSHAQAQLLVNFGQLSTLALESNKLLQEVDENEEEMAFDFNAGVLREQRMRDALSELVVLVWARPDSKDWVMLYGNQTWTMTTGLRINPPTSFPGVVEIVDEVAEEKGYKPVAPPGSSLWDHLQLQGGEANKLTQACQALDGALSDSRGEIPTFAVSGTLRRRGGADSTVLCRLTPADEPLDVAAAAIKGAQGFQQHRDPIRPTSFPPGLLYFCVIVEKGPAASAGGGDAAGAAPESGPAEVPLPSKDMTTVPIPSDSMFVSNKCKRLELSNVKKRAQTDGSKQNDSSGVPGGNRPPSCPYDDVRLLRMAGEGSFGKVYFGLWNGSAVAVKVISSLSTTHQELSLSPDVEAELSSLISHPNLVRTYQYCLRERQSDEAQSNEEDLKAISSNMKSDPQQQQQKEKLEMWIVQEWCDGGTLRDYCTKPKLDGASVSEVMEIGLEIAKAIAYLHDRQIIHGDLTPNNVMLKSQPTRKGYVCKVCDFGRARICDETTQEIMTKTMGTVTHMPPELFISNIDRCVLTPKADVYALGIVLYEVVTATCPFAGLSPPQVVLRVASGKRLDMPKEVPESMLKIYKQCVNRDPKERPTADQLIELISSASEAALGGASFPAAGGTEARSTNGAAGGAVESERYRASSTTPAM